MKWKIGSHKIFDDKNVEGHKKTIIDSVFIPFKKTNFNTTLACSGERCIGSAGSLIFCCLNSGGVIFLKFGTLCPRK